MRIFEIVKENVNLREAAERYGVEVNRYSMNQYNKSTVDLPEKNMI